MIIILQLMVYSFVGDTLSTTKVLGAQTPNNEYLFQKHQNDNDSSKIISCKDFRPNCGIFQALCNNTTFDSMMKRECPKTCGSCDNNFGNITDFENITTQIFEQKNDTQINGTNETKIMNREFTLLPDIQSISTNKAVKAVSASSLSKTIIKGTCFDEYIYCAEFTAMCQHGEYEEVMARHCSLTCERCDFQHKERETCKDFVECDGLKSLCQHEIYHELMKKQCRQTCNVCVPEFEGCKDRHKNCAGFKDDGFCENPIYSNEERTYLCGETCKLC